MWEVGSGSGEVTFCCLFDFAGFRINYWKTFFKTYHIGHSSGMLITVSINENLESKQHCHNSHYLFHSNLQLANLSECQYLVVDRSIFSVLRVSEFRIEFRLSKDISSHTSQAAASSSFCMHLPTLSAPLSETIKYNFSSQMTLK